MTCCITMLNGSGLAKTTDCLLGDQSLNFKPSYQWLYTICMLKYEKNNNIQLWLKNKIP